MKTVTIKELKEELNNRSAKEMLQFCLRLSKFKKENKEFLAYLLFDSTDEAAFIESVKVEIDQQFELINIKSYYFIKKSVRKILFNTKKYIRYSQKKQTEIDLLIYFCTKLKKFTPSIHKNARLQNIFDRQIDLIRKAVSALHEDLQFDYSLELNLLKN
jgi:predicted nucleotidyltransferase